MRRGRRRVRGHCRGRGRGGRGCGSRVGANTPQLPRDFTAPWGNSPGACVANPSVLLVQPRAYVMARRAILRLLGIENESRRLLSPAPSSRPGQPEIDGIPTRRAIGACPPCVEHAPPRQRHPSGPIGNDIRAVGRHLNVDTRRLWSRVSLPYPLEPTSANRGTHAQGPSHFEIRCRSAR